METERRSFPRQPTGRQALCQAAGGPKDDVWILGRSRDISAGGIGLILHRRFELGTILAIDFEKTSGNAWESFQVRVRHTTPRPDGFWILGCAFFQPLSEGQFHDLL